MPPPHSGLQAVWGPFLLPEKDETTTDETAGGEGAVAVAELPQTVEAAEESGVPAAQEANVEGAETPETEAGAEQKQEDSPTVDPEAQLRQVFAELGESNPELLKTMGVAVIEEEVAPDEATTRLRAVEKRERKLQTDRDKEVAVAAINEVYQGASNQGYRAVVDIAQAAEELLIKQAQDEGKPATIVQGSFAVAAGRQIEAVKNAAWDASMQRAFVIMRDIVRDADGLSADDRKAIDAIPFSQASQSPDTVFAQLLAPLAASSRRKAAPGNAAPDPVKDSAEDAATKLLKALETFQNNGTSRVAAGAGGNTSTQPRNETEARNWHATGKWTTRQMNAWLAKQD